jgi:hypothetical protein
VFGSIARLTLSPFPPLVRATLSRRRSSSIFSVGFSVFGLLFLLLATGASAVQVTVAWDAPHEESLVGYRLYYGYASGSYEGVVDVGTEITYTFTDLQEGQVYYFALASFDADGNESELSQEIASDGSVGNSEGDTDENGLTHEDEADQAESNSETVLDEADEMDADEPDAMPALEQESEDDQANDRSEAGTDLQVIPQSQLEIVSVDSEPLVGDGAAESAIDGRIETFWRTEMGAKAPVHPHELVIALGGEYVVRGFRYLPRQDGQMDGMVARYSFYVSEDGINWGKAMMRGTFSQEAAEQEVTFTGKMGGFVRFVAYSEVNGKPWTSVAEIKVLGAR